MNGVFWCSDAVIRFTMRGSVLFSINLLMRLFCFDIFDTGLLRISCTIRDVRFRGVVSRSGLNMIGMEVDCMCIVR